MNDGDDNHGAIKILFVAVAVFLMSTYNSCSEVRLSLMGRRATGNVEQVLAEVDTRTKAETGTYIVHYNFAAQAAESQPTIRGSYHTDRLDALRKSIGEPVSVLYLAGNPEINRIPDHREWLWVVLFLVSLAALMLYIRHLIRPFGTT